MLSSAKLFLPQTWQAPHTQELNVAKNAAYPQAIAQMKAESELLHSLALRQSKALINLVEQEHCLIKRSPKPGIWFHSFNTARRILRRFEVMNMLRTGQVVAVENGDVLARTEFLEQIFGVAA